MNNRGGQVGASVDAKLGQPLVGGGLSGAREERSRDRSGRPSREGDASEEEERR